MTYLIEAVAVYMSLMQKLKELIKLSNLCNYQLFASSTEGNISHQKLRNCWVAKRLMSRTAPVKFRVFRREFLRNYSMNWTQILREKVFFLLLLLCCASRQHKLLEVAFEPVIGYIPFQPIS